MFRLCCDFWSNYRIRIWLWYLCFSNRVWWNWHWIPSSVFILPDLWRSFHNLTDPDLLWVRISIHSQNRPLNKCFNLCLPIALYPGLFFRNWTVHMPSGFPSRQLNLWSWLLYFLWLKSFMRWMWEWLIPEPWNQNLLLSFYLWTCYLQFRCTIV